VPVNSLFLRAAVRAAKSFSLFRYTSSFEPALTLITTPHPCEIVPYKATQSETSFSKAVAQPFRPITVAEEVKRSHKVLRRLWEIAEEPNRPKLNSLSWVAKESDRNPNQPPVVAYGVAMDHEYMVGLYREMLVEEDLLTPEFESLLGKLTTKANELKRSAKIDAARICLEEPDEEHTRHLEEQFFQNYTPGSYLREKNSKKVGTCRELLQSLQETSQALLTGISNAVETHASGERAQVVQRKMELLSPWGSNAQARLPAADVSDAVTELLSLAGIEFTAANLLHAIEGEGLPIESCEDALSPTTRNMLRFYRLYDALGDRISDVVLANYRNHLDILASYALARSVASPGARVVMPRPLAEDTGSLTRMADDLIQLYSYPYFYHLALKEGVLGFLARSDTTRSGGVLAGNFGIMACLWSVVNAVKGLFYPHQPVIDFVLGQGSSPPRGLFSGDELSKTQYFLPVSYPKLSMGITIQPGPGIFRIYDKSVLDYLSAIDQMNRTSLTQSAYEEEFTPSYVAFMRAFLAPGEKAFREVMENQDSWYNKALLHSQAVQRVFDRRLGARWKPKVVRELTEPVNEERAITVNAVYDEIGFPGLTVFGFVYSVRAFLRNHPEGFPFLINLYHANPNFRRHMLEVGECLLSGDERLIRRAGFSSTVTFKLQGLLRESRYYFKRITGLPGQGLFERKKKEAITRRIEAQDEGIPRYAAFTHPPGMYN